MEVLREAGSYATQRTSAADKGWKGVGSSGRQKTVFDDRQTKEVGGLKELVVETVGGHIRLEEDGSSRRGCREGTAAGIDVGFVPRWESA